MQPQQTCGLELSRNPPNTTLTTHTTTIAPPYPAGGRSLLRLQTQHSPLLAKHLCRRFVVVSTAICHGLDPPRSLSTVPGVEKPGRVALGNFETNLVFKGKGRRAIENAQPEAKIIPSWSLGKRQAGEWVVAS